MKLLSTIMVFVAMIVSLPLSAVTKVACIGNSITYGYGLPDAQRPQETYPSVLQQLLGSDYEVGNFGHSGATLLNLGHNPYMKLPEFQAALAMKPDIAVIHLGVNDTDPRNWPEHGEEFKADYCALIDSLRVVNPEVRIIIARLTPIGASHFRFRTGTRDWRLLIQREIEDIAALKGVELIDFDKPLRDRQNLMPDAIHPDAEGYALLAKTVMQGITGRYGGLRLSPYYQSGMVLQRHRPLSIRGTADAGSRITLTLDEIPYTAIADNRGEWSVTTAPLADGSYTLTVTDGHRTISLPDIVAGEVWLASGQSNMEFPLSSSVTGPSAIASSDDPFLRFYNMRPVARTDNTVWPDSILAGIDTLGHFLPSVWQNASPATTPEISAVAYHFARQLRDSLNVPVGIIINAVGGAPCESWIDINTLEKGMPEILRDWRHNDYIQKWAQGRADKNAPAPHRHPYEPSYLFSSGIRPLSAPDIAGVIWYQGESNAHNVELHEQLFPMLLESWRKEFHNPELPFCFAQLSSIERPSWPHFRDSQRQLSLSIPNTYMAVTSDLGDRHDVHPRRKRAIGKRLARQALHNVYGHSSCTPSGPIPLRAEAARDGSVIITFDHASGLTTSNALPPATFEIAGTHRMFHPAEAEIQPSGKIRLKPADGIDRPSYVRYGWQPYTEANVINSDSLPLTTFQIPITNMNQLYETEAGLDRGISAPFVGKLPDGTMIVAGGCNFPCDDPLGPTAQKKTYQGIYSIDPASLELQRIGSLSAPTAYGASVTLSSGIALIGGITPQGPSTSAMLLKDGLATEQFPSLPQPIDNMAAAAIGNTIYVAGGNLDGTPSRQLFALDLDNRAKGWRKLKPMPGNPRVQPVMAAAAGKLYLWGGFAGRHGSNEPTLELDGLCYDPATAKWSRIDGPKKADGTLVATGGATAVALPSGSIAVAGGVNKDVFLAALIDQAPDYLNHPIAWYSFNPTVFYFSPATATWTEGSTSPLNARAGAASIPLGTNDFMLIGGELKPRIRTNRTIIINQD